MFILLKSVQALGHPPAGPRWHHPQLALSLSHRTHTGPQAALIVCPEGLWKVVPIQLSLLALMCLFIRLLPFRISRDESGATSVCCSKCFETYQALQVVPSEPFPLGFRWEADIRLLPSPQVQARALVPVLAPLEELFSSPHPYSPWSFSH